MRVQHQMIQSPPTPTIDHSSQVVNILLYLQLGRHAWPKGKSTECVGESTCQIFNAKHEVGRGIQISVRRRHNVAHCVESTQHVPHQHSLYVEIFLHSLEAARSESMVCLKGRNPPNHLPPHIKTTLPTNHATSDHTSSESGITV